MNIIYMLQRIPGIRHFRKCLGKSGNAWHSYNCLGISGNAWIPQFPATYIYYNIIISLWLYNQLCIFYINQFVVSKMLLVWLYTLFESSWNVWSFRVGLDWLLLQLNESIKIWIFILIRRQKQLVPFVVLLLLLSIFAFELENLCPNLISIIFIFFATHIVQISTSQLVHIMSLFDES